MAAHDFKAIFFDLDGTLVDIHGPLFIAAKQALDDLGHQPPLTRERFHASLASNDVWLGVPENIRADYAKLAFAYFLTEIDQTERMEVLPHVHETLAELKRRDYVTGVITSRPGDPQLLLKKLAMVGLAPHLDHVVTQDSASLAALDKSERLRETAEKAGVAVTSCMYVGDEPRDIMAAINAGYGASVAVATGAASFTYLQTHQEFKPDHVLKSMGELLGLIDRLRVVRTD
ncbi:MAG: Haloacid dehalogenase-like hydrolase [Candidatus Binatus sp.]|nr:Haloacid dehalogenase-like hydrolase [Candidatus Binatus sp.]